MEEKNTKITMRDVGKHFSAHISENMSKLVKAYISIYNNDPATSGKITQEIVLEQINNMLFNSPVFPKDRNGKPLGAKIASGNFSRHLNYHSAYDDENAERVEPPPLPEIFVVCDFFGIEMSRILGELSEEDVKEIVNRKIKPASFNNISPGRSSLSEQFTKVHFSDNSAICNMIIKAKKRILISGSGMQHIFEMHIRNDFFSKINSDIDLTSSQR